MTIAANAWMDYVERACGSLYPNLRQGIDYVWGRRPLPTPEDPAADPVPLGDPEMLFWSDKLQPVDMGAIQTKAQEYADTDPNVRQEPGTEGGGGGAVAPAAPTVTPIGSLTAPVAVGTAVADITGEGTYAVVTGAGSVTVAGSQLQAAVELTADTPVGVTATNAAGTSPEGTATVTVAPAARSRSRKNDDE